MFLSKTVLIFLIFVFYCYCDNSILTVNVNYNGKPPDSIYLRGDNLNLNWQNGQQMKQIGSFMWSIDLTFNSNNVGEILSIKPLVRDIVWSVGANFQIKIPKENSTVNIYPWFYNYAGEYSVIGSFFSPQLNNTRQVVVYTPPSYNENTLKTISNVLIMHDGQNLFNASTSFSVPWDCQDTVNQLIVEGGMEEVIIVGVYNTPDRLDEYTYSYDPCYQKNILGNCVGGGGKGDLYLDFLVENIIPVIDSKYRVSTSRENLGILGSSLGGLISCYAGWTRSTVWSKIGCMSSSFWWNTRDFNDVILATYPKPNNLLEFYLDSGNCCPEPIGDDHYQTLQVRNTLEKDGYKMNDTLYYYLDNGGQHNEYYWGKRFYNPMLDFYPPSVIDQYE
eukprot:TRINITY_DN2548_c0_g1_i1.p1 TRINITY_DN2548_c0_g1~~TRINITY_DN2548_c0_g1_i1.p1  ORF type:complete len:390 (-),score=110.83 TRINITY_DN2548_c0_g1_i1:37-1206(-)